VGDRVAGAGQPVVVRRAVSAAGLVAVGVRGVLREQRYAAFMALRRCASVSRRRCVMSIASVTAGDAALNQLRPMLDDCGWVWGVSGSAGFELARVLERCTRPVISI
jgi:phosphoribosyl-dephospho-CoA transferase